MEFLGIWIFVEFVLMLCKGVGFLLSATVHVLAYLIGLLFRVLFFWVPRD